VTSLLAFCSIIYELLLANTLSIVTNNQVWWQSLTIGVYIGGLGIGAYLSEKLKNEHLNIIWTEIGLSFLGMISVVYIYILHGSYEYIDNLFFHTGNFHSSFYVQNIYVLKIVFFIFTQSMTLAIGILSGFEIPLMIKIANKYSASKEEYEYQIFGINYIGTLIGTSIFAYFLMPKLDVIRTSIIVAGINVLVCLYFLFKFSFVKKRNFLGLIGGLLTFGAITFYYEPKITQSYLKLFYYMPRLLEENKQNIESLGAKLQTLPEVERMKSLYQYVDIFEYPFVINGEQKTSTILTLDTNFQFNTSTEFFYHEAFAHISIAMNKRIPKKVLLLGGGDGLLLRELVKYEEIEEITFIELDQKMVDLAKTRFSKLNQNSVLHPKVRAFINDGFYYLRNTNEKFDAIYIDFPYPNSYDLSRLYSVEFYKYVHNALNDDGFIVLDAPFIDKEDQPSDIGRGRITVATIFNERHILNNSVLASTFYYAGFKTIFPYRIAEESFMFLKKEAGAIDYNFMETADLSKISSETKLEMKNIKNQIFPYEISKKYINSIFKPMIVRHNDL
jgi:spermidine synthase